MKKLAFAILLVAILSCGGNNEYSTELPPPGQEKQGQTQTGGQGETPTGESRAKTPGSDWTKTEISEGLVMWSFKGKSPHTATNQIIDIIEVDMNLPRYTFHVKFHNADSVSNIFKSTGAVVATNAGYGPVSVFIKDHGVVKSTIDQTMATDRNEPEYAWCNDGGVYGRADGRASIEHTRKGLTLKEFSDYNLKRTELNIVTSSPMLIDNFDPVGYSLDQDASTLHKDYTSLQNNVNPRTAVAVTDNNHMIFAVVNGRFTNAKGMTIAQLTKLLVEEFNPQYAINMDGGGSSTLCVKGLGDPVNNVVNYPTDNSRFDHYGQRKRRTTFYIMDSGK
ncbi:MAG: phosphodiester glycosidase family protein [Bacteroidales bacterium]|nr:phosphodiester glycosidase family protein [Bacteroidales bacterium]